MGPSPALPWLNGGSRKFLRLEGQLGGVIAQRGRPQRRACRILARDKSLEKAAVQKGHTFLSETGLAWRAVCAEGRKPLGRSSTVGVGLVVGGDGR